ncbi:unnamed protein product [Didymodactylos carnosus]|nr:unnamed protein product [Didymodactylos carnosus]CAF4155363.1 unnamed protein product [Didymodactylos carnosus]
MTLAEINEIQSNGSTALHAATYYGHREIVKLLLKCGASRSIKNKYKCIPYEETENENIKKLFIRPTPNRFIGNGTGHIDWMKCDDEADEVASDYRYRHSGYGWKEKHFSRRLNFIRDGMSHANLENIQLLLDRAEKEQNPEHLITAYTAESDFYKRLNEDLATTHFDQGSNFGITYFVDFFYNNPEFAKLSYKGKVYRGMTMTRDDLKQYGKGVKLMNKAFMSSTKDRKVAEEFAKKVRVDRQTLEGEHVYLSALCTYEIVNNRTGLDIEQMSEYKHEKEVLIGPYSAFVVVNVKQNDPDYVEIELRECEKKDEEED